MSQSFLPISHFYWIKTLFKKMLLCEHLFKNYLLYLQMGKAWLYLKNFMICVYFHSSVAP